jgi:hypothetical protein
MWMAGLMGEGFGVPGFLREGLRGRFWGHCPRPRYFLLRNWSASRLFAIGLGAKIKIFAPNLDYWNFEAFLVRKSGADWSMIFFPANRIPLRPKV